MWPGIGLKSRLMSSAEKRNRAVSQCIRVDLFAGKPRSNGLPKFVGARLAREEHDSVSQIETSCQSIQPDQNRFGLAFEITLKGNGLQMRYQTSQTRKGRYSEHGRIYLITSVTKNRQAFFSEWRVGRLVAKQFQTAEGEALVGSLAWVVMPDHFHWLIELREKSLSEVTARTKSRINCSVNKALGRTGGIWQRGFHDRAIRREEDLKAVARYIILNPVRAGLVKRVGDYPLWDAVWI